MKSLFTLSLPLFALLSVPALAQEGLKPRIVESIRVSFAAAETENDADREFSNLLRGELNKCRDLVVTSQRADYAITVSVMEIADDDKHWGFAVALLTVEPATGRYRLMIEVGPQFSEIAERAASKLQKDVFQRGNVDK